MLVQVNVEELYVPHNTKTGAVGYVLGCTAREVRTQFTELMGMGRTWESLKKEGWVIVKVDLHTEYPLKPR